MPYFLKKNLAKWSTIAALGVSAYFLGYFLSLKQAETPPEQQELQRNTASEGSNKTAELSKLK